MKQGLSYIAVRTDQLRYSTATTEDNINGVIQNDPYEQWLHPISIYYAAEDIKRGQPLSVATYDELSEDIIDDGHPYVVLSNTLIHKKCIGLAMEPAKKGEAVHILPFGKFEFDIIQDEDLEYNPFEDLLKSDKEEAYKKLIGKPVFVKSHTFEDFKIGNTGDNSDITNEDREVKGELTVLEEETYYGNRNVIQVGFITDAPLKDGEHHISIEVQPEGDGRGPVDNSQYELILGEDINVSSKGQILALALGKEKSSNFEFSLNFSPLKTNISFGNNDFIAIQKFDGETTFVTFKDGVDTFEKLRDFVNKDNNTNDNAFINIAGEYLEAVRKFYAIDGREYKNHVEVVNLGDLNMETSPDNIKSEIIKIIEALNSGFSLISNGAELKYDDFVVNQANYGPDNGLVSTGGTVTIKSTKDGGYYDLYISESLRAKLFEGSSTKNRGSYLNEGKAVIADVRIPARQNVIGLYYNRDYDRPINAGANILVMYQGAFDKIGDIENITTFETGKEYFLGFRGAICLAGENKWYETMRIGSAQTPTRLIVDCGNGIKRFYGEVPCGYIKPTANNVEEFGYLLMDGGETLPKDVKYVTDKDGNEIKPHRYESSKYPDIFNRLKTWYSPYELDILPSCKVVYSAGTYLPIDPEAFSSDGNYFIYTHDGFTKVENPVRRDANNYFAFRETEEVVEVGETFIVPKVVSFKSGTFENYCQIKWLPESIDSVVPEIPYIREYGFFGADDGGHYQPVIKPLDVDSLIHIGYFSEEINEDMLDIHLFVDLNNSEENADWVEVLPGFHLFNNTSSYGFRWKIDRIYEDDTARCRFVLKTDLNTGYVREDESQSVGIAYVIDPHRPPQILFGYRYKVVVRRYSERQREWNLGAALTASVKDHVIDPVTNMATPYPVSGIAVESFINRVSEYNNLSVIDSLTIGTDNYQCVVNTKALSFNVASNDIVFSNVSNKTRTNIKDGVLKVGLGTEVETLDKITANDTVLNSAQVVSLFTTDWTSTKIFNTYNDGGIKADKDESISQLNAGLLRGIKPSKVTSSEGVTGFIPYVDDDGNFEVKSSITNIISDKQTIKTGYRYDSRDIPTPKNVEKEIVIEKDDYDKLEVGKTYSVEYSNKDGSSGKHQYTHTEGADVTDSDFLKEEISYDGRLTKKWLEPTYIKVLDNGDAKVTQTIQTRTPITLDDCTPAYKIINTFDSFEIGEIVFTLPEGITADDYEEINVYKGTAYTEDEVEVTNPEFSENTYFIYDEKIESSTIESLLAGVDLEDEKAVNDKLASWEFEDSTQAKAEISDSEDPNKDNWEEKSSSASLTEQILEGYTYYVDGVKLDAELNTKIEDNVPLYDKVGTISKISYKVVDVEYESSTHNIIIESKNIEGIEEQNKTFNTEYDFSSNTVSMLFGTSSATLKVGAIINTSSIKYKQVHATDGKSVEGYDNKFEGASNTFTNIKVRTSDEDISYDGTVSSDFGSGMTRFSALQALHEMPLALWSYNEDEEWMKRYFSIIIEQLSEHKNSGLNGHDIYASPNGDQTECKENSYEYTDDEKDSIKTFLSLVTDTQEQGMNVISSIGILFKAAKETQARLLELEYSAFGRDAKSLPGDKSQIKSSIECRDEGLYESDDTTIDPNKSYFINLKKVTSPTESKIKKYYILENDSTISGTNGVLGEVSIDGDVGPFEFDVPSGVQKLEDLEVIGSAKVAISCRNLPFDEDKTYYEYDKTGNSDFYRVKLPEIDDIQKYYELHVPYKEITQAPMYIGLNRIVRALCHEIYNTYDPSTIGTIFHNQEPVSRIDELYKLIYGDQNTDSSGDALKLIKDAKTYPNVVSDVSTDSQHESYLSTDANEDWFNNDKRENCDDGHLHKEIIVGEEDLNEADFSSVVNAVNRIVLKLNNLTAEVNGTDNIKSGPVRLNALRDNVKHLLDHLYFTDDGEYLGDPTKFDGSITTADCSHTRKSRIEKLEDLLFARIYSDSNSVIYKDYSQYTNNNNSNALSAPYKNLNYDKDGQVFYTSIIDIIERTLGKNIVPLNDANAQWFNLEEAKNSRIDGYDEEGKVSSELNNFYVYDINLRRTKDVDERLKNIERLLDETIDSLTATREVKRLSKFVRMSDEDISSLKDGKFIPYTIWSNYNAIKVPSLTQEDFESRKDELYVKHNFLLEKAESFEPNAEYYVLSQIRDHVSVQFTCEVDKVNDNFAQVDFYCEDAEFFYREDYDNYTNDKYHMHNDFNFTEGTKLLLNIIEFIQKLVGINFIKNENGKYEVVYADSNLSIEVFKDNLVKNLSDFYTETTHTLYRVKHVLGSYYTDDRPLTDDVHDLLETVYGSNGSRAPIDRYTDGTLSDASDSTEGSSNKNIIDVMAKHEYAVNYGYEYSNATLEVDESNVTEYFVKVGRNEYIPATEYSEGTVYYKKISNNAIPSLDSTGRAEAAQDITLLERNKLFGDVTSSTENSKMSRLEVLERYVENIMKYLDKTRTDIWNFDTSDDYKLTLAAEYSNLSINVDIQEWN